MPEKPKHTDDPSFNPSDKFNRENRNTTREGIEDLGSDPKNIANKIFSDIRTYLGKIGNEFRPGEDAHNNFIEHSEKLGLSNDDSNKAASALSKLSGSKSGLPFGFNKDGTLTDPIQYKNGGINFDSFLNQDFDSKATEIKDNLKKDPYNIGEDELTALKEYLNKASAKFRENAKIDLPNDIKQAMKDISSTDKSKRDAAISKLKDFFGGDEYNNIVRDNENRLARNEELNSKEGSGNPKSNYKVILALIFLAEFGSALGFLVYLLQQYAGAHTGCMKFKYNSSTDSYIYSTKIFCDNNKTTFPPLMCYCAKDPKHHKSILTCNKRNTSAYEPAPNQTPTYPDCKGGESSIDNYLYYSYQVMDPASAGLDIAQKAAGIVDKGIGELLKMIIHAAIVIGIILGVLLVLWIIYKVVANRKPAETHKIETGSATSAPSTLAKFGNRGYLGNLSKYSNYAYMGRCVAQPARPYIPPRFKF